MTEDAKAIYQDFLDTTGDALVAGDADTFLARIFLPHRIVTETETVIVPDSATALRHFNGFHQALMAQGVDTYTRVAKTARFAAPDRIIGQHEAFMTQSGKLAVPRFENEMEIELRDGIWGATWVRHHARFVSWPDLLPRAPSR